jgi:hypothetical protein
VARLPPIELPLRSGAGHAFGSVGTYDEAMGWQERLLRETLPEPSRNVNYG